MNDEEYIDILNGIIKKMNCTGFSFDIDANYGNRICIKLLREKNFLYEKRHYRTYEAWETIDDMFFNFAHLYSAIESDKKIENTGYRLWVYDVINENGFNFLEIASRCSSWKEFMLKMQLMGIYDES
jgi:uncharacterized protein (DUF488 family)